MSTDSQPNKVQFVGHSSVLATLNNRHFLIDPILSDKLLGVVKRKDPPGIDIDNLPPFSALLVTHAHYDHLDLFSYKFFPQKTPIIVPAGLESLISRLLNNPVIPLHPWSSHESDGVKITALPAMHFGFRLSGMRYTRCNAYALEGKNKTVFHAGDTAYGPHFADIGNAFSIDAACLPIGPLKPAWFMKKRHLDSADALRSLSDLKGRQMIPIHWGSFRLGIEPVSEAMEVFVKEIENHPLKEKVKILKPGESIDL